MRSFTSAPARHLIALKTIVMHRGGLEALGMNGLVAREVFWYVYYYIFSFSSADICLRIDRYDALVNLCSPRFHAEMILDNDRGGNNVVFDIKPTAGNLYKPQIKPLCICDVLHSLKSLSLKSRKLRWRSGNTGEEFDQYYLDEIGFLESQLVRLVCKEPDGNYAVVLRTTAFERAFFIASLLYSHNVLRNYFGHAVPPGSWALWIKHSKIIQEAVIEFSSPSNLCTIVQEKNLVFWMVFVGAACSYGGPFDSWYQQKISDMSDELDLSSWEIVRKYLNTVGYVEEICDARWKTIWLESRRQKD
jgi:hypothetical protein